MSIESFERRSLLFGPSPVHPLNRLTEHLGGARLWAKREDCNSGIAYGGNKTRKLEYLVGDALRQRYHAGSYGIPDEATGHPAVNGYSALFS